MTTMPFSHLKLASSTFQNPRTHSGLDDESIGELAIHIGLHGLLNPPLVNAQGVIIAGQRRYRALEFLIYWFAQQPRFPHSAAGDHQRFVALFGKQGWDLTREEILRIERVAGDIQVACPVRVVGGSGLDTLALADNIQREQLSGGEVAQHLHRLSEQGATGVELARLVGKSKTYVSRKLSAWRGASPELRDAWTRGAISDEPAQEMAALPHEDQVKALAGPVPRGRRGPANRPGIDTLKGLLDDLQRAGHASQNPRMEVGVARYAAGVVDAMRWITGENASPDLVKLITSTEGTST